MKLLGSLAKINGFLLLCFISLTLYGNGTIKILPNNDFVHEISVDDPVLVISVDNGGPWLNSISTELGSRLTLWYKITLDGATDKVRIVFPVYDKDSETSIGEAQALMTNNEWNTITLAGIDPDDYVKKDDLPGVVDLNFLNGKSEVLFQLASSGTLSQDAIIMSESVTCEIQRKVGRKWNSLGEITISKKLLNPSIVNFCAEKSVLINGEKPVLSWSVVDADEIVILEKLSKDVIHTSSDLQSTWTVDKEPNTNIEYLLRAKFQSNSSPDEELPIKLYGANAVETIKNRFDKQELLGLYNHPIDPNGKMIALVKHNNLSTPNVLVWESKDGLLWEKSNAYSKIPAFMDNERNTVNVPLEFAGSPGIVYRNKLYLIGGSRFDPNMRSNEVYFYDFGDEGKGWQKGVDAGFSKRMGHNCVVYNDEIWVLGGSDSRGALNECWIYDGTSWKSSASNKLPSKKCMASAMVVNNQIQVFGGFGDLPGFPDQTVNNATYFDGSSWRSFNWAGNNNKKYSACAVTHVKDKNFVFSTNYDNGSYRSRLEKIGTSTFSEVRGLAIDIPDSYYNIQTTTFKDVVWLCITTQDGEVKTTDLRYLVYVN